MVVTSGTFFWKFWLAWNQRPASGLSPGSQLHDAGYVGHPLGPFGRLHRAEELVVSFASYNVTSTTCYIQSTYINVFSQKKDVMASLIL